MVPLESSFIETSKVTGVAAVGIEESEGSWDGVEEDARLAGGAAGGLASAAPLAAAGRGRMVGVVVVDGAAEERSVGSTEGEENGVGRTSGVTANIEVRDGDTERSRALDRLSWPPP